MAALPDTAPAKPAQPRKVLVLAKAAGFVHSCIPLAAKTVEALGTKTGAWTTTVTYDPAAITAENLKQYDLLFLDNTTGAFLDDPNDAAATAARKKALLEFVRSGKGLAGFHAAGDSYHEARPTALLRPAAAAAAARERPWRRRCSPPATRKATEAQPRELNAWPIPGSTNSTPKTGKVSQQNFVARFASVLPRRPPPLPRSVPQGRDPQFGTWPEFDRMIGGFFKFHWVDPQLITVKKTPRARLPPCSTARSSRSATRPAPSAWTHGPAPTCTS